jgi:hypothetical protein
MLFTFRLRSAAKLLFVLGVLMMIRSTYHALHMTQADIDHYLHPQSEPKK